jgi:hypothetical protein
MGTVRSGAAQGAAKFGNNTAGHFSLLLIYVWSFISARIFLLFLFFVCRCGQGRTVKPWLLELMAGQLSIGGGDGCHGGCDLD